MNSGNNEAFEKCIQFIIEIGIQVEFKKTREGTLLPGFEIDKGILYINKDAILYPGDILHEAGHIAVVPANERSTLNAQSIAQRKNRDAEEMMAIAWSYAACVYLDIDAEFVFHESGYKEGGSAIANNFKEGRYIGVPMLQWVGMTFDKKQEKEPNNPVYPAMLQWLRS